MAQNAATVTAPNPTPPTNMACTGATPPNPPNYTRQSYINWVGVGGTDGTGNPILKPAATNPPPFFDDGAAASGLVFVTNTAALTSGVSASDTGTGTTISTANAGAGGDGVNSVVGTYPGATSGLVPASASVAHEAAGTETSSTGANNINYTYPSGNALDTNKMVGVGPALTAASILAGPNANHASSLSPATNPTLTSIASIASGGGTGTCTATGTNFTRQSVLWVNGISYPTTWVSATSITATTPKRATAGTWPVYVITGGVVTTATVNWTFS
jgi:hypothetical protein